MKMNNKGLSNKKLLVISPHFITFVREQVLEISKYFNHVDVIVPLPFVPEFMKKWSIMERYLPRYDLLNCDSLSSNIKVHEVNYYTLPLDIFRRRKGDLAFKKVDKFIQNKEIKFDLIHAHFTYPFGYIGVKLKEKYGRPLVITVHENRNWFLEEYNSKNPKLIYSWKNADVLIRVNKIDLPLLKNINNNFVCIPNGFDKKRFYPLNKEICRDKLNLPKNIKILFTLGNLVEQKGHKYAIQAISEVVKIREDIMYLIGGSGKLKKKLQNQINNLNLQNNIKIIGFVPDKLLNYYLNACDLFVLPSLSEGNPTVMFECLGCGKPFIGTKVGGIPEIIVSDDYGLLCEPANPKELAENILVALNKNWDEEYILNYAKQFTWEKIAKEIIRVYKDVMEDET
ncbi:MAG: glycosyltransferase [Candidatus Njordarchaeia archaeon]